MENFELRGIVKKMFLRKVNVVTLCRKVVRIRGVSFRG